VKQIPAADLPDIIGSQFFENILRRCRSAVAVHKTVSVAGLLLIWQRQSLHPQFVHEIEIVAKMANDFIMKSSGVIVTEYCKKAETWEKFKALPYTPSVEFLKTLISTEEQQSDERAAYMTEKEQSQLAVEVQVFRLGSAYWQKLYDEAEKMKALTYKDSSLLKVAASVESTGKVPSPAQARAIMAIKERLEKEGIFV